MYAKLADLIAALLEPFLNDNPGALDRSARIFDDGDQSHKGTAIGKEIIDNENVIFRPQKLFGENHIVCTFVCERLYFRVIDLSVDVDALCFLRKYNRNMKILCRNAGNPDSGSFNRQYLRNLFRRKPSAEFLSDFIY